MIPFYKKYISALLHNPNLLTFGGIDIESIQREKDATAESAINLLVWSKYLSKTQRISSSSWNRSYTIQQTIYPPFHNLYAFITGKQLDSFNKAEIFKSFKKEIYFLRKIYKNVEPDREIMKQKPMILDLFGYVHEAYH